MNWGQRQICIISLLICAFLVVLGLTPRCGHADEYRYYIEQCWSETWHPVITLGPNGDHFKQYIYQRHGFTELRVRVLVKRDNGRWESYLIPITVKDGKED